MRSTRLLLLALPCALGLALQTSCTWTAPPDDAGDEAWVRMVLPSVLGRKPRGTAEVRVLSDMAGQLGREAVVDVLLTQPEFLTYWTQVLADDLLVERSGVSRTNADCWGDPLVDVGLYDRLIHHVAYAEPTEPFCVTWGEPPPQRRSDEREPPPGYQDKRLEADQSLDADDGGDLGVLQAARQAQVETKVVEGTYGDGGDTDASEEVVDVDADFEFPPAPASAMGQADNHSLARLGVEVEDEPVVETWSDASTARGAATDCFEFNMTDLVHAAIRHDDLYPVYRGYLGPLATFLESTMLDPGQEVNLRERGGSKFMEAYTQRDTMCLKCHASAYSTTDARPRNGNWDRFSTGYLDLEGAAFAWSSLGRHRYGGHGTDPIRENIRNFFRSDQHANATTTVGIQPFGMADACVTNAAVPFGGFQMLSPPTHASFLDRAAIAGMERQENQTTFALMNVLREGVTTMGSATLVPAPWAKPYSDAHEAGRNLFQSECQLCHNPHADQGNAPALGRVLPTISDEMLVRTIMYGSTTGLMGPAIPNPGDAWQVVSYLRAEYVHDENLPSAHLPLPANGAHALASLLASTIVDNVTEEVMGSPIVIDHGYARNEIQADAMNHLTSVFMQRWSLKDLVKELVLHEAFNRRAPADSQQVNDLPMLANPWAEADPNEPVGVDGANANSPGDFVHRYSVPNLLHSLHHAIGWAEPDLGMALPNHWGGHGWQRDVGRYESSAQRGVDDVDLAGFLAWERGIDACVKPDRMPKRGLQLHPGADPDNDGLVFAGEWDDYIDLLVAQATATQSTIEATVLALKDRMLADPSIPASEAPLLVNLFGSPLGVPFNSASHGGALRELCSVLATTPQFMLGGLPPDGALPTEASSLLPCFDDERCTEADLCRRYAGAAWAFGWRYPCPDDGGGTGDDGGASSN